MKFVLKHLAAVIDNIIPNIFYINKLFSKIFYDGVYTKEFILICLLILPIALNQASTFPDNYHRTQSGSVYNILNFGAFNDGQGDNTDVFEKAIQTCSDSGGGIVFIPAGTYLTGAIQLKSNIHLELAAGAKIVFDDTFQKYIQNNNDNNEKSYVGGLISGANLSNVTISGRGTFDGQGLAWWKRLHMIESGQVQDDQFQRPRLINISDSKNILIENITLKNSPSWTIHPINCSDITIDNVTIINPKNSPNTDGINPESCQNVRIINCLIDVGDDCIAIKSGTQFTKRTPLLSSAQITISNCNMLHGHGGVVIGSEMSGDVRDITISNCVFKGTDRGIRIKSRRGRGGVVENIRVNNIIMDQVRVPFVMNLYYNNGQGGKDKYVWDKNSYPVNKSTPTFRDIHFSNITARKVETAVAFIYGLPEKPIENITFNNIDISIAEEAEPHLPASITRFRQMLKAGIFCKHVKDIQLHHIHISDQIGPALTFESARDVDIDGFTGSSPDGGAPEILLKGVDRAFIHNCTAGKGTKVFLALEQKSTKSIFLSANQLNTARQPFMFGKGVSKKVLMKTN